MARLSFCSSRAVDFSPGRVTASIIADFQLCTDMFPGSAHINDTLVSIVTKGERRGKGVLRWAKGIQPKAATQGGWEEGSVFPTTGFRIYAVDFACPLAPALAPCTFRCNGAQSKSLTKARWDGGGTGAGHPFSSFRLWPGRRGKGGRVEDFTALFLQMGALKPCTFQAPLSHPGRVQQGSQVR